MNNELKKEEESFEDLLGSMSTKPNFEGFLTRGRIVGFQNDMVIIDAGLKSEGCIPLSELKEFEGRESFQIGDDVDVYVDRLEDEHGDIIFSAEKAAKEKVWRNLENAMNNNGSVEGLIFSHVKAGYAVNLNGIVAFLPRSQVDVRPTKESTELFNHSLKFKVMKMDRQRNNVVVSRRSVIEEERSEARNKFVAELHENQIVTGVVKNITDYGAFVDLGGVDGLLHIIDISWKRINNPSDVLTVGDTVKVKVIRFNKETGRISLGMKQLEADPWMEMNDKVKPGDVLEGEVTNVTDYGAFVEIFPGIEGLIYVTEISWTQKNAHPMNFLKQGEKIKVKVMDVDTEKRRISLSYKRCQLNPWQAFSEKHPKGSIIEGVIRNITEFGMFVTVDVDLDGMVHMDDIVWSGDPDEVIKKYQKGQKIKVMVLDVNPEKERISLGLKHLLQKPEKIQNEETKKVAIQHEA